MRTRRSALYVPADNARALAKAATLDADVLILDLEDAVAPGAKAAARDAACAAVAQLRGRAEIVIRVNDSSDFAAVTAARPDAILLPKVDGPQAVTAARAVCGDIPLWVMIETPRAVLEMEEIAGAGVDCLVLGSNDLLKEMGGRAVAGRTNLHYAMARMVTVARAFGIAALDGVHNSIDDADAFAAECAQARDFGFDGKTLIHPSQIAPCHTAFVPSGDEVAAAKRILAAFADNPQRGALRVDGRMVERLDAQIAEQTLKARDA